MGVDVGLDLVNQLPGVGCIYVDDKGKYLLQNIDLKNLTMNKLALCNCFGNHATCVVVKEYDKLYINDPDTVSS
jgi:hypothetical protein